MDGGVTPQGLVEAGYDRIADHYLASKGPLEPLTAALLEALTRGLAPGARVLDLGCGAGVPVTRWLAGRFTTVGVDFSTRQLALARRHVPGAALVRADMGALEFAPGAFAAAVACYSIIHLPREEQPALIERIARWLKPGGAFLATWATGAWEGEERDWLGWGAPMWWSHYDGETSLALLRRAGFTIEATEDRTGGDETWLWVLARKPMEAVS
jgi:SAM-dependent methyltransferase